MYNFESGYFDNLSRVSITIILVTKARTQFDKSLLVQKLAFENKVFTNKSYCLRLLSAL